MIDCAGISVGSGFSVVVYVTLTVDSLMPAGLSLMRILLTSEPSVSSVILTVELAGTSSGSSSVTLDTTSSPLTTDVTPVTTSESTSMPSTSTHGAGVEMVVVEV